MPGIDDILVQAGSVPDKPGCTDGPGVTGRRRDQLYGTQFAMRDGEWAAPRLGGEENADARRAEVGLPPMAEYEELLEALMRGEIETD